MLVRGEHTRSTLLLGKRAAAVSVALNCATLIIIGAVGAAEPSMRIPNCDYSLATCFVTSLNFLLVSGLLTLSLAAVIASLERARQQEREVRAVAESESDERRQAVEALQESETRLISTYGRGRPFKTRYCQILPCTAPECHFHCSKQDLPGAYSGQVHFTS